MITSARQLADLIKEVEPHDRVAIDTEADSLHCYREKLCLLQISIPGRDAIVDALADTTKDSLRSHAVDSEASADGRPPRVRVRRRRVIVERRSERTPRAR